jgi:hypothetical protein
VTLLASSAIFHCDSSLPNSVLRTSSFSISYVVLTELEKRHVRSNLGHRPSFLEEF